MTNVTLFTQSPAKDVFISAELNAELQSTIKTLQQYAQQNLSDNQSLRAHLKSEHTWHKTDSIDTTTIDVEITSLAVDKTEFWFEAYVDNREIQTTKRKIA